MLNNLLKTFFVVGLRRIVLDVLKPHEPSNVLLALKLSEVDGVDGVNVSLAEIDQTTETLKITVVGNNLDFEEIKSTIENLGAVIHSVDEIVAGKRIVESVKPSRIDVHPMYLWKQHLQDNLGFYC